MQAAQRRAHGRFIERERECAALFNGGAVSLRGVANEIRAEVAGHGTTGGMDRARYELLGKYGPIAINVAKRHGVSVDVMMCAIKPLITKINQLEEGGGLELEEGAEQAAAELFGDEPDVAEIHWPAPPRQKPEPDNAELEKARVAKKLEEREAERAWVAKAAELAKKATKKPKKKAAKLANA